MMDVSETPQGAFDEGSAFGEMRDRAASFARARYPVHAEKRIQTDLSVSEATAERILAGHASDRCLKLMLRAWGWRFAHFVLEPLCGNVGVHGLMRQIDDAESVALEALARARELRELLGSAGRDPSFLEASDQQGISTQARLSSPTEGRN